MVLHQQLHSTPQIYDDDLVYEHGENGVIRFGLVSSVSWEQDSDDSEEESYESDYEDEEEGGEEEQGGEEAEEDDEDAEEDTEVGHKESKQVKPIKGSNQASYPEKVDQEEGEEGGEQAGVDMVTVSWYPTFDDFEIEASKLVVKDRALLYDGIVARASDPLGQTGVVIDLIIKATLLFPDTQLVDGIPTSSLQLVHPFLQDVYVVHAGWLGRCVNCDVAVTVEFDDGSVCIVVDADDVKLPIPANLPNNEIPYFPAMILNVPSKTLKTARWIKKGSKAIKKNKGRQGVVIAVTPTKVEDGHVPPPSICPAKLLTVLDVHCDGQWTVGDYAVCPPGLRTGAFQIQQLNTARSNKKLQKRANELNVGTVVHTQTYVSICWQDGRITQERAIDLVPVQHVLHADFWPEDFVVGKGEGAHGRVGVVKHVDAAQRTCRVTWLDKDKGIDESASGGASRPALEEYAKESNSARGKGVDKDTETKDTPTQAEKPEATETEEVSMYAIESHPDFNYRLGCVVVRLNKDSIPPSNTTSTTTTTQTTTSSLQPRAAPSASTSDSDENMELDGSDEEHGALDDEEKNNDNSTNSNGEELKPKELAWVGQIVNIYNGVMIVHWADGSRSKARPEELYRINEDDYDSESSEEGEDSYENEYL